MQPNNSFPSYNHRLISPRENRNLTSYRKKAKKVAGSIGRQNTGTMQHKVQRSAYVSNQPVFTFHSWTVQRVEYGLNCMEIRWFLPVLKASAVVRLSVFVKITDM